MYVYVYIRVCKNACMYAVYVYSGFIILWFQFVYLLILAILVKELKIDKKKIVSQLFTLFLSAIQLKIKMNLFTSCL